MKRFLLFSIFCIIFLSFSSCPELFKDVEEIIVDNQSDFTLEFFVDDEYRETIAPGTTYQTADYTKVEHILLCTSDPYQWGPVTIVLDKGTPYIWTIENPATGNITVNNNSSFDNVCIIIGGLVAGYLDSGENGTYSRFVGNYNLIASTPTGSWQQNIDLTEEGYIWNLEANIEFFPSENCQVWNFEDTHEDHLGIDDWDVKGEYIALSTLHSKFGDYSYFATSSHRGNLIKYIDGTIKNSQSACIWVYFTSITNSFYPSAIFHFYDIDNRFLLYAYEDNLRLAIKLNGVENFFDEILIENISLNTWHLLGISYNADNTTLYIVANTTIFSYEILDEIIENGIIKINFVTDNNYLDSTQFIDEAFIAPNQFIDPQIFVDHYTHNAPWGEEYIP